MQRRSNERGQLPLVVRQARDVSAEHVARPPQHGQTRRGEAAVRVVGDEPPADRGGISVLQG